MLDSEQRKRYSRHLLLPEIGVDGQQKLLDASVLIVGAGGLGSPVALYLAAAGVGRIGLVDFDAVDASNLQRQVLFGTSDVGRPKIEAARERLHDLNPGITIELFNDHLTSQNALEILGSLQATEVIKQVCGFGDPLVGRVLVVDAADMRFRTLTVPRDPSCPVCGESPEVTELIDYEAFCAGVPAAGQIGQPETGRPETGRPEIGAAEIRVPETGSAASNQTGNASSNSSSPTRDASMFSFRRTPSISVRELAEMREREADHLLLDVRTPAEVAIADIGGTVIPMSELQDRSDELEPWRERDVVVMCRSGARSARVVQALRSMGFEKAVNLEGGILAWSNEIDDSVPTY